MSTPNAIDHPPQPVPIPSNFPVVWENPTDEQLYWQRDRMHFPDQIPPLESSLVQSLPDGINAAFAFYEIPASIQFRRINTYWYDSTTPKLAPPEVMEAQGKRVEENVRAMIPQMGDKWEDEWLPEIKAHLAFWQQFDLAGAPMTSLLEHLDETIARYGRVWQLHFIIVIPMMPPMHLFDEFYHELFGQENAFGAYELLEGLPNKTVESGLALWRLSRMALANDELRAAVSDGDIAGIHAKLQASAAGQSFLAAFDAYLQEFGQRGDKWGARSTSWIEDPTPVWVNLRDYMRQTDRDLEAEMDALTARREQRIAETRRQLQGYPQPVVQQFEFLLSAAQLNTVLSEDHGYWIDFCCTHQARMVLMEFGRRLAAAGAISESGDVFYLTLDEMRQAASALPGPDCRALVAARKAEMARFADVTPPPNLGTPPLVVMPANPADVKFWGAPPKPSQEPGVINGNPGSPGVAQGTARVIHLLSEAAKLQPGDILVAETTAPPWTPLFATAAAVVTDTGGVLSHCAVVAREYGIPAVVGTGVATSLIRDGQTISVDGSAGVVRILG